MEFRVGDPALTSGWKDLGIGTGVLAAVLEEMHLFLFV